MSEFGDVVLFEGKDFEGKILRPFTGKYHYCAIQTGEETARVIDMWGDVAHDLFEPMDCYKSYVIMRHKNITSELRDNLKMLHKTMSNDYDLKLIFELFFRKLIGKKPDLEDLSRVDKFNCSSRIAKMYVNIGLELGNVNHSQFEPRHFISKYFDEVRLWKRKNEY